MNGANIGCGIKEQPAVSRGSLLCDLADRAAPKSQELQFGAVAFDLVVDLLAGHLGRNVMRIPVGGRRIEGIPVPVYHRNPSDLGPAYDLFTGGDVSRVLLDAIFYTKANVDGDNKNDQ